MAQNYSQFATSEYLQDAPAKLNNNFSAVASQFAGTAFPNTNLVEGMVCYRTDLDKVYRYVDEEWVEEANLKDNTRCVEFIKGTQTSSTGSWKGVTQDSSLYDGKTIFYYLPKAGSGNATLNLTLPDGTTTGAKAVRTTGTTQATTHYAAGSVISLTYVQSENAWCRADYNSNTTYSAMSQSEANTGTATSSRTITAKVLSTTINNKAVAIADTITDEDIEELWAVAVTITQSANQTITVTASGVAYTSTFTAQPGTTWTATIVADEGYNAGTLSATSGTLTDNITISATPATSQVTPVTPTGGYVGHAGLVAGSYTFNAGTEDEWTYGGYASNDFTGWGTFTVDTAASWLPVHFPTTLALLGDESGACIMFSLTDFAQFISSLEEAPQHLYVSVFYLDVDAPDITDGVESIVLNNDLTTGASTLDTNYETDTATALLFYNNDLDIPAADKTISEGRTYYIVLSTAETSKSEFIAFTEQAWGD